MIGDVTIKRIDIELQNDLKKELRAQGHYLTGALEQSIQSQQISSGNKSVIEMSALDYADDLFEGVPPEHIDESNIAGLIKYAEKRFGYSGKQAIKAAVAIARKHRKEGMPTKNSYNYSSTGERLFANEEAFDKNQSEFDQLLESGVSQEIDQFIDKTFDQIFF